MAISLKSNSNGTSGALQINSTDVLLITNTALGIGKTPGASLDYRETVTVLTGNTTVVASNTYVYTSSITITLPASPTVGDWVKISNRSGTETTVIARNGSNIMGLAEDFTVDILNFVATFVYANTTQGWVIV